MALMDYIWLVRLIMEILKLIADMAPEERVAIAQLRIDMPMQVARKPRARRKPVEDSPGETSSVA